MSKEKDPKSVMTKKVRFSYCHVWSPQAMNEGDEKKYSVSILIDKDDKVTVKRIKAAIKACEPDLAAKCNGKLPKVYKSPLRDGDEDREDDENYENKYFVNANSKRQPGIVDEDRGEFMDESEFYSGCYGRVTLFAYAYNFNGNKGIALGLNNIQKLADGERLGGGASSAADDFDDDDMMD